MSRRLVIITIITVVLFVVVLGLVGYFSYLNIAYVDTLHARVDGAMMQVRVPAVGRLVEMPLEMGDAVAEHEELGDPGDGGRQRGRTVIHFAYVSPGASTYGRDHRRQDGARRGCSHRRADDRHAGRPGAASGSPPTCTRHASPRCTWGSWCGSRFAIARVRRTFWGRVEQMGRATNVALSGGSRGVGASTSSPAEVPVRISVDPAGYTLYPGMTADVRIKLSPRSLRKR